MVTIAANRNRIPIARALLAGDKIRALRMLIAMMPRNTKRVIQLAMVFPCRKGERYGYIRPFQRLTVQYTPI